MDLSFLLTPPVAFLIFVVLVYVMFLSGKLIAAKGSKRDGKDEAYACGEEVKGGHPKVNYFQFFVFAMFFTIIHIVALIFGTATNVPLPLVTIYLAITGLSLIILMRREIGKKEGR
ncbi:MAG: hypothetical protein HZC28_16910 [Spirochaetes bacterium]|nr:hypothetical protein [Spirochaetota bacterium]